MKTQQGRTILEILMILSIIGILSLSGMWYYTRLLQEQKMNDLLNAIHLQLVQISSLNIAKQFDTPQQMDEYLKDFTVQTKDYIIEFHSIADEEPFSGSNFVAQVRSVDGRMIKGAECRRLLKVLSEQKMTMDMSFSLKNEELEDGSHADVNIRLNDKVIDLDSLCGG